MLLRTNKQILSGSQIILKVCNNSFHTPLIPLLYVACTWVSSFCLSSKWRVNSPTELDPNEHALTLKALRDGEDSIVTGAGHRVATPVGFVHAIERNMFSMENSVGFQIRNPQFPGVVEDAASFDADGARSCARETQFHSCQLHDTHLDKTRLIIMIPGRTHRNNSTSVLMFSRLTPTNWLGRPVSCVPALYFSLAVQNIVVIAAVP